MMNGLWVVFLWMLVGIVFLVKTTPIRGLVGKVRRQPPAIQAAVALCLLVAVITGGTKPGGTNGLSNASQPVASAPENSLLIIHQSSLLPSWWTHDATDTDGDGIPDLWEKWTHGNRQVADGGIDRDEDGLTDLEEFQSQTDPRTADTDGDGFDDGFEVGNGMNPIVQADFTPVEPDENENGIIDLWENAPYFASFTDADEDGFDDIYGTYYLELASEDNYDVVVDVYTTRSAALTWTTTNATQGIVLQAAVGTSVRLRLPFGEDTQIALLPAPEGDDPPGGELWKSRMQVAFSPRPGQGLHGNALVSADGMIAHTVVILDRAICCFTPQTSGIQTLSLTGGVVGPSTDIRAGKFEVVFDDNYHDVGDGVGPFTVTNRFGLESATFQWSSDFGGMTPDSGMESWLTVARIPRQSSGEEMTVLTTLALDAGSRVVVTSIVEQCLQKVFTASLSTNIFSPHLGETLGVGVTLPGCNMFRIQAGWRSRWFGKSSASFSTWRAWTCVRQPPPWTATSKRQLLEASRLALNGMVSHRPACPWPTIRMMYSRAHWDRSIARCRPRPLVSRCRRPSTRSVYGYGIRRKPKFATRPLTKSMCPKSSTSFCPAEKLPSRNLSTVPSRTALTKSCCIRAARLPRRMPRSRNSPKWPWRSSHRMSTSAS